jgi:hypothetical protein
LKKSFKIFVLTLVANLLICGFAYKTPLIAADPINTDAEPQKPTQFPVILLDVPRTNKARTDFALFVKVHGPEAVDVVLYGPGDAVNSTASLSVNILGCTRQCGGRFEGIMRKSFVTPDINDSSIGWPFHFEGTGNKIKSGDKLKVSYEVNYKGKTISNSVVLTVP